MAFKPETQVEATIFDLWKEVSPSDAFTSGLNDYAGKMLVPDVSHVENLARKIDDTSSRAETRSQQRFLASLKEYMNLGLLGEAQIVPDMAIGVFFAHLVKEGIVPAHIASLADHATKALTVYAAGNANRQCPPGIKILTSIRCAGLIEVADTIGKQTRSKNAKSALSGLVGAINDYSKIFGISGFKNSGFDEIAEICSREGCDLGRKDYYPDSLVNLFDYSESPSELEAKGQAMLDGELAGFKREVEELAPKLDVDANAESVAHAISEKKGLKPSRVIAYIKGVKQHVSKLVSSNVVRINPRYRTKVVETPTYMSGIFPSGGAMFLDFLTRRPFQVFLATTDPRRAPETSPAELLNLLIHEEYGHCVHSSNSATSFWAKPTLVDMLPSLAGSAVSEGISFHREVECLKYFNEMKQRKATKTEQAFLKFLTRYEGSEEVLEEYAFFTHLWRIVRFLRVIGDARVNSGRQNLMDFVDWANKETGLSRSLVYHQVFPAHQGNGPGYASTYAVIGESLAAIQQEALRNGKRLLDFDTYASSLGFPPRSVFEEMLRTYARS